MVFKVALYTICKDYLFVENTNEFVWFENKLIKKCINAVLIFCLQSYIFMLLVWLVRYLSKKIISRYTRTWIFRGFLQYDAVYIGTYVPIFRGNVFRVA